MSGFMTLQEVCRTSGVTRRALQGYEAVGLVAAVDKNKYGYLLYGEKELERIKRIKFYQQIGFRVKEIKDIIDAPNHILKAALEEKLLELEVEHKKLNTLMEQAKRLIAELG